MTPEELQKMADIKSVEYGIKEEDCESRDCFIDGFIMGYNTVNQETASLRKELEDSNKQRKYWYDQWFKIVDAIVPKAKCRDCADENGICPNTKVPCDPTDAIIFMFNEERAKSAKLV